MDIWSVGPVGNQGETHPKPQKDEKQFYPFVCGLCDCSYVQFVSFYKHFKNHSKEVGQDSFHICEDQPSSERDVCDDQSESLETFNCGRCPASFITVCLLHEHMKNHESKGSYTLDMQSNTGYPSSKQYPCVSLGSVNSSSLPTTAGSLSKSGVQPRRGRKSKQGPPVDTVSIPHSKKKSTRGRPSNYVHVPPSDNFTALLDTGRKTRRSTNHNPPNKVINPESEDRHSKLAFVEENSSLPSAETKPKRGRPGRHESLCTTSVPDKNVKSTPGRPTRRRHLDRQSDNLESIIKSEPVVNMNEEGSDELQDDIKVYVENAEEDCNENDLNMEMEDNDDESAADFDCYNNAEGEEGVSSGHGADEESADHDAFDEVESRKMDTAAESLKTEADTVDVENVKAESAEFQEEEARYKLRQKPTSHRKRYRKRGKSKKKVQSEQAEDSDYVPEVESNTPLPVKDNNVKRVKMRPVGKRTSFTLCKHCGMAIRSDYKETIKKHEAAHNTRAGRLKYAPKNLIKCEECNRVLLKGQVKQHNCTLLVVIEKKRKKTEAEREEKRIADKQPTPCHICGVLVRKNKLRVHLVSHSDARPYSCPICSNAFKARVGLTKHVKDVHGERSFQCSQCPWAFTNKHQLKSHCESVHARERRFACTHCGKLFNKKKGLKQHMQIHDRVQSFACKECPKVLSKSGLEAHVRSMHRKLRSWICSWEGCGKMFIGSTRLRRHMLIHTGEKPEKCSLCDSGFTQRQELKSHMKRRHNTDEMPPPNNESPYSDVVPHLIRPQANDGDTSQPSTGGPVYKTIMFTKSALSKTEKQKLKYQLFVALQQKGGSGQKSSASVKSTVQSSLDEETNPVYLHLVGGTKTEQGTNDRNLNVQSTVQRSLDEETHPASSVACEKTEHGPVDRNMASEHGCMDVEATREEEEKGEDAEEGGSTTDDRSEQNISSETRACAPESTIMPGTSHSVLGTSGLSMYSNRNSGQGTSGLSNYSNSNSELGTSGLSIYSNSNSELGTLNLNTALMQGVGHISRYNITKPEFDSGNTGFRQSEYDTIPVLPSASNMPMYSTATQGMRTSASLMQGSSSLSKPPVYDNVKAEMDPRSRDVQTDFMSAGSLQSTMMTGVPYPDSEFETL